MNDFNALDQMQRYVRWRDDGYYSSTGRYFGIGKTTNDALARFSATGKPMSGSTHPSTAGNGSLMRLAPVPMFCAPSKVKARLYAGKSSRMTHAAKECIDACSLFTDKLVSALMGEEKDHPFWGQHAGHCINKNSGHRQR